MEILIRQWFLFEILTWNRFLALDLLLASIKIVYLYWVSIIGYWLYLRLQLTNIGYH